MPMSLKCMIDKWLYKGQISQEEYNAVIKKLDGHDKELLDKVMQKQRAIIDEDGVMYRIVLLKDIEDMKAEVGMTDELKQWEYDRGYEKGREEREEEIVDLIYLFEKTWNKESHKRVPHKAISELIEFIYQTDTKERVAEQMQKGAENNGINR